jgi:RNA polymerase sigma factor (sigma-70 family)
MQPGPEAPQRMIETNDHFQLLMSRVREGSEDAAWELVGSHGEAIRRAVRRALNERLRSKFDSLDFVQIVWNSFFRDRDRLEHFDSPEELARFLIAVAHKKVHIESRRRLRSDKYDVRRERPLDPSVEGGSDMPGRQPSPIEVAIAREQWDRLLQGQPDQYRQFVRLRLQGHTYQAIGEAFHLDARTVRRFFKKLLEMALS